MNARPSKVVALLVLGIVVAMLSAPTLAASKKSGAVVVGSYQIVGEKVLVEVTNSSRSSEAGCLSVQALVAGAAASAFETFELAGGATAWIAVGFLSPVDGVIALGISDSSTPVL